MKRTFDDHTAIRLAILVFNVATLCLVILNAVFGAMGIYYIYPWNFGWFLNLVIGLVPLLWGIPFVWMAKEIYAGNQNPSFAFGILQIIFWGVVPGILDIILTVTLANEGINPLNDRPQAALHQ